MMTTSFNPAHFLRAVQSPRLLVPEFERSFREKLPPELASAEAGSDADNLREIVFEDDRDIPVGPTVRELVFESIDRLAFDPIKCVLGVEGELPDGLRIDEAHAAALLVSRRGSHATSLTTCEGVVLDVLNVERTGSPLIYESNRRLFLTQRKLAEWEEAVRRVRERGALVTRWSIYRTWCAYLGEVRVKLDERTRRYRELYSNISAVITPNGLTDLFMEIGDMGTLVLPSFEDDVPVFVVGRPPIITTGSVERNGLRMDIDAGTLAPVYEEEIAHWVAAVLVALHQEDETYGLSKNFPDLAAVAAQARKDFPDMPAIEVRDRSDFDFDRPCRAWRVKAGRMTGTISDETIEIFQDDIRLRELQPGIDAWVPCELPEHVTAHLDVRHDKRLEHGHPVRTVELRWRDSIFWRRQLVSMAPGIALLPGWLRWAASVCKGLEQGDFPVDEWWFGNSTGRLQVHPMLSSGYPAIQDLSGVVDANGAVTDIWVKDNNGLIFVLPDAEQTTTQLVFDDARTQWIDWTPHHPASASAGRRARLLATSEDIDDTKALELLVASVYGQAASLLASTDGASGRYHRDEMQRAKVASANCYLAEHAVGVQVPVDFYRHTHELARPCRAWRHSGKDHR